MKTVEEIIEILKNRISDKRLYHSKCVMNRCIKLARIYGIDEKKASLVGIAHDNAREMSKEEWFDYCNKHDIEISENEKLNPVLLHAKVGANIAKDEFGFSEDMVDAIKYHTVGHVPMNSLSEILFISDSISEDRNYDDIEKFRKLAEENKDKAMLEIIESTINLMISRNKDIDKNTIELKKYYLNKINQKNK